MKKTTVDGKLHVVELRAARGKDAETKQLVLLSQEVTITTLYESRNEASARLGLGGGTKWVNTSKRNAYIVVDKVDEKGKPVTLAAVKAAIAKFPKARLRQVLAHQPIIDPREQAYYDKHPDKYDELACKQAVRSSETGELVRDQDTGALTYRLIELKLDGDDDVDNRTQDSALEGYIPEGLGLELSGVVLSSASTADVDL